ncbi:probable galacturonosyltransferase 4 isoform X1 [Pistacia vera]|uniref:probable galacturonosyltransferase 4 isoform X1 n=1 Tax=Pistacia vera TaxID=55513 RepID=UPI001262EA1E|nr:probable galacturonosyltransferase 4 isoform X1 [Pistacia vera]
MKTRNLVLLMLCVTVIAPIVLYTDRFSASFKASSSRNQFLEDLSAFTVGGDASHLNLLPQESSTTLKVPIGIVFSESREHKLARVLSTTNDVDRSQTDSIIKQVTDLNQSENEIKKSSGDAEDKIKASEQQNSDNDSQNMEAQQKQESSQNSGNIGKKEPININNGKRIEKTVVPDARVRQLKDQLIRAKVYLSLPATRNNPNFIRELRLRIKEVQRSLGDATKDSDLPKAAYEKLKAMEQSLAKGKQIQDDCAVVVKKLRAMLHSTEEQLRVHKKQALFLTQLTAKTLPKGLHCLPLRLTTEYYTLNSSQQQFPNQGKLEDPRLFHYALFSDNVLAAAVVVNSTITNAKHPGNHVFHIVTDRLNYAAMRMWFLVNPPGRATIQVQNIEEFTWLNASYSPVLKQLASQAMIDYYFRTHRANSDANLKFRNPKYLSILNHLRFYLPEIFPKLNKVLFLDDDIVVKKDLSGLWSIDLKGNVNGAVETCGETFHRFDRYLNFSNPLISKNFEPRACGWAYGMNIFDLDEWRRQNITEVYHTWQKLNHDRQLWKLGTLPPGLITFWKRTYPLDRNWHVLGLGYNPSVNQRDIERAAVVHYNGNMKPWLEIGIPKYRNYWAKYVDYDHQYLRECNINP